MALTVGLILPRHRPPRRPRDLAVASGSALAMRLLLLRRAAQYRVGAGPYCLTPSLHIQPLAKARRTQASGVAPTKAAAILVSPFQRIRSTAALRMASPTNSRPPTGITPRLGVGFQSFIFTLLDELQLRQGLRRCYIPIYVVIIPPIEADVKCPFLKELFPSVTAP